MRHIVLTATFAGLFAGFGLLAGPVFAQDMTGEGEKPKAEAEDAQDEKAAKKAAKKAKKQAQKKQRGRGMDVERYVKQLTQSLELNEEQSAQLRTVLTDNVAQMQDVREDAEAKTKELETARDAAIRNILSDEQTAKFEEMQAERDNRRKQRAARGGDRGMRGGDAGGRGRGGIFGFDPRQVIGELGLDEGQQQQAREIMQSVGQGLREKIGAARQQGPEAMKAAMQEVRESVKAQFSAILDEDQRAKFEELTADPKARGKAQKTGKKGKDGKRAKRDRKPPTPAERMQRRLDNVLSGMAMTEDEQMILEPKIREILQLDADTGATAEAERKALEALVKSEGEVDGEAIRARMDSLRKVRESQQATRSELETELRELVTIKQEGQLFLYRVLR